VPVAHIPVFSPGDSSGPGFGDAGHDFVRMTVTHLP
jgi:hypothetical protein